ncbi:nuclear transport factor 2 family protein [uncultured Kordia sp.]|uniref:nuclear transport factor 2 family protein n=1 Tax=uncultured Kordia sp. TaxID=507699 RepID=UPI0026057528|nr:nuclear transport factor 2 family protein [uncultured Kordia sp.]
MKRLFILFVLYASFVTAQENNEAAIIVQKQVEAYNARDIQAFSALFSDDVKMYDFPKTLRASGKVELKKRFGQMFQNTPDLFSYIEDRIASENKVIDHEKVTFKKGEPAKEFIVMYIVENKKITEVYYIKR